MARGITEKDVFTACDALVLAGERPTIERVRQKIGRGSPNTVSPMLDAWFMSLGRRLQGQGAFAPAPDVPDPVLQAAQHFWDVAQAESRRDVDSRVSDGLAEAAARANDALRTAAQAESTAASAAARIDALEGALTASRDALEAERLNHRSTATQLEGASARCAALAAQVAQLQQAAVEERARADHAISVANAAAMARSGARPWRSKPSACYARAPKRRHTRRPRSWRRRSGNRWPPQSN